MPVESSQEREEGVEIVDAPLQTVVDSMRDCAIVMLDRAGRIQTWNEGARRLDGYEAGEVVGEPVAILYGAAAGRDRGLLADAERTGRASDEGWRIRKDGTAYWASVELSAVSADGGERIGFAMLTRDLTERRGAAESLRQSEERFRLLVDSVRDYAIFLLDPDGRVQTWNRGAEIIKGYCAAEIVGREIATFYTPEDRLAQRPAELLAIAARDGRVHDVGWRLRKDGSRFWADIVLTALRDGDGTLIGFAKVTRDLTERRIAENERVRLERAQEAVRLRDEFLSIASHELRTPLAALQLQLDGLAELVPELDDARLARRVDRARQGSERLNQLIASLLDVSRLSSGQLTLATERVDLAALAHQQVASLAAAAADAGCELVVRTAGAVVGAWDAARLGQVIASLLSNAIKYGAGAPVTVAVWADGDDAVVEVSDLGPGVAEADRARVFERFERAASPHNYGGLGLGLYVTREIVAAHGGAVTVDSGAAGGARFTVRLPRSHPGAP